VDRSLLAVLLGTFTLRFSTGLTGALLGFFLGGLADDPRSGVTALTVGLVAATFYLTELVLSPPFGLLLFVMKGVAPPGTTMRDIYLAGAPFIACVMMGGVSCSSLASSPPAPEATGPHCFLSTSPGPDFGLAHTTLPSHGENTR